MVSGRPRLKALTKPDDVLPEPEEVTVQLEHAEMKAMPVSGGTGVGASEKDAEQSVRHGGCMAHDWPRKALLRKTKAAVILMLPQIYPASAVCGALHAPKSCLIA